MPDGRSWEAGGTILAGVRVRTVPVEPGVRDAHRTGSRAQTELSRARQYARSPPQLPAPALDTALSSPLPRVVGLRRALGLGSLQETAEVSGDCGGSHWAFPGHALGGQALQPCRASRAPSQGPGSAGRDSVAHLLVAMTFPCSHVRAETEGYPPGCHSFLPANCLALSPPAPPQPSPLLHFASNANCAWTKHSPLSGCQLVLETHTRAGRQWLSLVGSRHSVAQAPWTRPGFLRPFVLQIKCPNKCQHSCSRQEGPDVMGEARRGRSCWRRERVQVDGRRRWTDAAGTGFSCELHPTGPGVSGLSGLARGPRFGAAPGPASLRPLNLHLCPLPPAAGCARMCSF